MAMSVPFACRQANAGPWSIEPKLGVSADYISNPLLHSAQVQTEENVAAIIDFPLRYDADDMDFLLRPNGRLTSQQGYSSLGSNYERLDAAAQASSELGSTALQGELARDTSLYYLGALVNGIGVQRDTATASGDWTRHLTERSQLALDASWTRVRYAEQAGLSTLIDYRYLSAGPTVSRALSERDTLRLLGSYGLYRSLNGTTESRSENLQLAFVRQLTETWTLSTTAGYSRSVNSQKVYETFFFGTFYLGTVESNQNGAVYSVSLTRQGERLNLSAGASRALQPTGFAFLSRQDGLNFNASYTSSERWDFAAALNWLKALNPQVNGGAAVTGTQVSTRYLNAALTANWHWTAQWTVAVTAAQVEQQYGGPPPISAGSTNVTVNVVRQFLRTQFP